MSDSQRHTSKVQRRSRAIHRHSESCATSLTKRIFKLRDHRSLGKIVRAQDIAKAVAPNARHKIVGIRPGEKLHEQMISPDDAPHTYDYGSYFKILPAIHSWSSEARRIGSGVAVGNDFEYSSNTNPEWITVDQLAQWIDTNRSTIGTI